MPWPNRPTKHCAWRSATMKNLKLRPGNGLKLQGGKFPVVTKYA